MSFPFVVSPSKSRGRQLTLTLLMWPPQASGRHRFHIRNQSPSSAPRPPVLHDVMATRRRGDELRVMDICIGTFPFSPLASVHIKSLAHHISIPFPRPSRAPLLPHKHTHTHTPSSKPTCGGAYFLRVHRIVYRFAASQSWERNPMALPPFRQRPACELSSGTEKMRFNAAFNLFHKLRQGERERERERGLKGRR